MSAADNDLPVPSELDTLKARADTLGVKYHPSISVEKLREKVNAALTPAEDKPVVTAPGEETESQYRERMIRDASELVRIRVTCMNPNKKELEGEIFSVGNSVVGTFKKFVPFNIEGGWHVPRIIYNQLLERQCQVFVTKRDARGNTTKEGKLIREFAIEVLPALTQAELDELARRQAMAGSIEG